MTCTAPRTSFKFRTALQDLYVLYVHTEDVLFINIRAGVKLAHLQIGMREAREVSEAGQSAG
jgi:hypothetical protein